MSAISKIQWTDRTGRRLGGLKSAAKRLNLTFDEYMAQLAIGLKHCWRCAQWKHEDQFDIDRSRYDGRAAKCRACSRVQSRQMSLLAITVAERDRIRYATDAKYRHARRQHSYSRKRGIDPIPHDAAIGLLEWADGLCLYCPAAATTWDHIIPVSKGGKTEPGNMAPACVSCNSRKKDLDVYDFVEKYDVPLTDRLDAFLALALEGSLCVK